MATNIKYVTNASEVDEVLEFLEEKTILGFDVETNGLDPNINDVLLIQIGDTYYQFVFDVYQLGRDQIMRLLMFLRSPKITKIGHYMKFDYSMIKSNFGIELENIVCTFVGSSLLTKGIISVSNTLEDCLKKYLRVSVSKAPQKSFIGMKLGEPFSQEQIIYAGEDVQHLIPLHLEIQKLLDERGMNELSMIEYETVRACGDMEVNGIFLHPAMWAKLEIKAREEADKAKEELDEVFKQVCPLDLFGKPVVNYNSPVQLKPLIEELVGHSIKSTGEDDLQKIDHDGVKKLLDFRQAMKNVTTYGTEFTRKHINRKTGRVHSTFKQLGTDSGRMSSKNPNVQNLPAKAEYRACFRVKDPSKRKMICADFSSQELALTAAITREEKFIYALNNGMDGHCYSASLLFDLKYEDFFDDNGERIPEMDKKYRKPSKSITFGLIYGMKAGKLANDLKIPYREAVYLLDKYFEIFPAIKKTLDEVTEKALKDKYAYSPLDGRRRIFSGVDWDNKSLVGHLENVAKNHPIQGAAATITKLGLCKMKKKINTYGWDALLVNCVHDEILVESSIKDAEEVAAGLEGSMVDAFYHYVPDIKMSADAIISDCWVKD